MATPEQQARTEIDRLLAADGVIAAKKLGATLSGVELRSGRYARGLPPALPTWRQPLPFFCESTGAETHFTYGFDPEPHARSVFAFHRPELLADEQDVNSADVDNKKSTT